MKLDFREAETFRQTLILRQANDLAYAYETAIPAADADGAPNAYHPGDAGKKAKDPHIGLDALKNAGYPKQDWWPDVLVPDPKDPSVAYCQESGATKGFFVAMTALQHPGGDRFEPTTYVDATAVPYVVIPTGFEKLPLVAGQGDVGLATDLASGTSVAFIVGDAGGGSDARLGEASIALFNALGYPDINARTGAGLPKGKIQYILFPHSRKKGTAIWPRTAEDIAAQVAELIGKTPGISPADG